MYPATCTPFSMRQAVNHVIHAEFVRLVREIHHRDTCIGEFPILADVVVHVRDRHQASSWIVVLEQPPVRWHEPAAVDGWRRERLRVIDLEERVEHERRAIELYPV